nr:hypothetical protein [Pasteurella multocida]
MSSTNKITITNSVIQARQLASAMEKELVWLKDCHSQVLQQSLKDLESAFKTSFKSVRICPNSRKRRKREFPFPQGCKIEQKNDRLYLPKIGWVRYRNSREIVGEVKNVTVSMKCGRFFVSIQTEFEQEIPTHKGGEIGIDMALLVLQPFQWRIFEP